MKRTPLKRRPKSREKFAYQYHSDERARFVKRLACAVCLATPSENAHPEGAGGSLKHHYTTIIPLCGFHHRTGKESHHALGSVEAFEAVWSPRLPNGFDWIEKAAEVERLWQEWEGR